jgi:hypothetical protein
VDAAKEVRRKRQVAGAGAGIFLQAVAEFSSVVFTDKNEEIPVCLEKSPIANWQSEIGNQ